ncbi:hypothetical protein SAMN04488029_0646 [Reichenbachiella faecimaris]|uniref:Uncharacterized protein n=1 Tax=Reichenbachiella faecimaris TaxID=692418 RepID=A0A1W2G6Q8_REIFA|nr:hypothetical protein [Reichenbachiella faecimaris]SMD32303.1 hypothetical protein SAMN04488029_0646 [Reichenbachiella faecimaris]
MKIRFPNYFKAFAFMILFIYLLSFGGYLYSDDATLEELFNLRTTIYILFGAAFMSFILGAKLTEE